MPSDRPRVLAPPETLPCGCGRAVVVVPDPVASVEEVKCPNCERLLRRRPPLCTEERAQAAVLRWAAAQLEGKMTTRHRRKPRGDKAEYVDDGLNLAVMLLKDWSRRIHRNPLVVETPAHLIERDD